MRVFLTDNQNYTVIDFCECVFVKCICKGDKKAIFTRYKENYVVVCSRG